MDENLKEKFMASRNEIYKIRVGSHLYGTSIETSDEDFVSLFIADKEYYLGLLSVNEVDNSLVSKQENGKNDSNAVDNKAYEFKNFMKLAIQNNPNILEFLFVNNENIIVDSPQAKSLRNVRHKFLHKGLIDRFVGYAKSQKHKAIVKAENITELIKAKELLENKDANLLLLEIVDGKKIHNNGFSIKIGDLTFNKKINVKDALKSVTARCEKAGWRKDGMLKYGCDFKFLMHLVRLLLEAEELLITGDLKYPLKDAEYLLDIRNGKYNPDLVLYKAEEIENRIFSLRDTTIIPERNSFDYLNNLTIAMIENFLYK